jgi:hypothetical protein
MGVFSVCCLDVVSGLFYKNIDRAKMGLQSETNVNAVESLCYESCCVCFD